MEESFANKNSAKEYECSVCQKLFSKKEFLNRHFRCCHIGEKRHTCNICQKQFFEIGNLKRHLDSHAGVRSFACHICMRAFIRKHDCIQHVLRHTKNTTDKNVRDKSQETFYHEKDFAIHTYPGIEYFCCNICKKMYTSQESLKKHVLQHTKENRKQKETGEEIVCDKCQKTFYHKKDFATHTCSGKKYIFCDVCKDVYSNLEEHVHSCNEKHISNNINCTKQINAPCEKKFTCQECGKEFRKNCLLKNHMVIHTGEKPFECEMCHKRYGMLNTLRKHQLTHREKLFFCDTCRKGFITKYNLVAHIQTHKKKV